MGPGEDPLHWTAATVLALLVAAVSIPVARSLGRGALVDRGARDPDGRAMPRTGGLGIAAAWAVAILATTTDSIEAVTILAVAGFALVVGLHDDLTQSSPRWRLAVLGALALNAAALGFRVDTVALPGGSVLDLGPLALPLSALWILGTTVAFNFIDGLDGLAAGLAVIACFGVAVLSSSAGAALAAASLGGACVGFFLANRPPASLFMGDNGSNLLGIAIGCLLLKGLGTRPDGFPVLLALLLISVPVTDAAMTVLRRARGSRGLFAADRAHLHHRLEARHGTSRALTLLLMAATISAIAGSVGKGLLGLLVIGALLYEVSAPGRPASP